MEKTPSPSFESFYDKVKSILEEARSNVYRVANTEMVQAYWGIGQMIVEEEQKGSDWAEYGMYLVAALSAKLTAEYGKGFDKTNLWNMICFYRTFSIVDAVRLQLSWTHYRILMRIEKEDAREFYLHESVEGNWSTRQLERQVNSHYFERIVMTQKENRSFVKQEADSKKEQMEPAHIIKDPYVLEFLNLKSNITFYESELEQALIDKLQEFLLELGKGFSFVSRQYHLSADTKHF